MSWTSLCRTPSSPETTRISGCAPSVLLWVTAAFFSPCVDDEPHDAADIQAAPGLESLSVRGVPQALPGSLDHLLPERLVGQVVPVGLVVRGLVQGLRGTEQDGNPVRRVLRVLHGGQGFQEVGQIGQVVVLLG